MAECLPERQGREDPDGKAACGEAGTSCVQNRPIQEIWGAGLRLGKGVTCSPLPRSSHRKTLTRRQQRERMGIERRFRAQRGAWASSLYFPICTTGLLYASKGRRQGPLEGKNSPVALKGSIPLLEPSAAHSLHCGQPPGPLSLEPAHP